MTLDQHEAFYSTVALLLPVLGASLVIGKDRLLGGSLVVVGPIWSRWILIVAFGLSLVSEVCCLDVLAAPQHDNLVVRSVVQYAVTLQASLVLVALLTSAYLAIFTEDARLRESGDRLRVRTEELEAALGEAVRLSGILAEQHDEIRRLRGMGDREPPDETAD